MYGDKGKGDEKQKEEGGRRHGQMQVHPNLPPADKKPKGRGRGRGGSRPPGVRPPPQGQDQEGLVLGLGARKPTQKCVKSDALTSSKHSTNDHTKFDAGVLKLSFSTSGLSEPSVVLRGIPTTNSVDGQRHREEEIHRQLMALNLVQSSASTPRYSGPFVPFSGEGFTLGGNEDADDNVANTH